MFFKRLDILILINIVVIFDITMILSINDYGSFEGNINRIILFLLFYIIPYCFLISICFRSYKKENK